MGHEVNCDEARGLIATPGWSAGANDTPSTLGTVGAGVLRALCLHVSRNSFQAPGIWSRCCVAHAACGGGGPFRGGAASWGRARPRHSGVNGLQCFPPLCSASRGPCADLPLCPHCLLSRPHKPSVVLRLSRVHEGLVNIAGEQEYFMLVATPAQAIKSVPTQRWGLSWLSSRALCTPDQGLCAGSAVPSAPSPGAMFRVPGLGAGALI